MNNLCDGTEVTPDAMPFDDPAIVREFVRIPADRHTLDGCLAYPALGRARWAALIAGPHPFLGGQRRNNVVDALQTAFARHGAAALSFDYSRSDDESDESAWLAAVSRFWESGWAPGEDRWADDANAAMAALCEWCRSPAVLVGYSFGCWVVARAAALAGMRAVVLIAPNPKQHCFKSLNQLTTDLLVVHSDRDLACPTERLVDWFDGLGEPKTRLQVPAGEHFFRGRENDLASAVVSFLSRTGVVPGAGR